MLIWQFALRIPFLSFGFSSLVLSCLVPYFSFLLAFFPSWPEHRTRAASRVSLTTVLPTAKRIARRTPSSPPCMMSAQSRCLLFYCCPATHHNNSTNVTDNGSQVSDGPCHGSCHGPQMKNKIRDRGSFNSNEPTRGDRSNRIRSKEAVIILN